MAKFAIDYTYRTPMRTIEFSAGSETIDADVIADAEKAGALVKDEADASDGLAKRSATRRPIDIKD